MTVPGDERPGLLSRLPRRLALSSLRQNFAWAAVGNAYYMATQWAMLMVLAKAASPEVVGRYSFALALTAPIVVTSMMGLRQMIVTDAKGEYAQGDYLALRLSTSALAGVAIVGVAIARCHDAAQRATVILVGAAKLFEGVSDLVQGRFQWAERMDRAAISLVIKGTGALVLMGLLLRVTGSVVWGALGIAASNAAVLFFFDLPQSARLGAAESFRPRWNPRVLWSITKAGAPLAFAVFLASSAGALPRFYLEEFHGLRQVGYYAAASAPLIVMSFLPGVLSQATIARAALYYQEGAHDAFVRLNARVIAVTFALNVCFVGGAALLGRFFLTTFFTAEYAGLHGVMVVFTFSQMLAVAAALGTQLMAAARMFRLQLLNALIALVALYVASRALVPTMGVRGTAWAEVIRNGAATLLPTALSLAYVFRREWFTARWK